MQGEDMLSVQCYTLADDASARIGELNCIQDFIDTLEVKDMQEYPVSEDLEKAAEEYAYTNWASDDYHEGAAEGLPFDAIGHTEKCFKAGAKWGKNQAKVEIQAQSMALAHGCHKEPTEKK